MNQSILVSEECLGILCLPCRKMDDVHGADSWATWDCHLNMVRQSPHFSEQIFSLSSGHLQFHE